MKVNDIIKIEACESLGTPACNGRVLEFDTFKLEKGDLNVIYVRCDDDGGEGYVTAAAPHRVVDDMGFILK
jgi:hypothetical protein